MAKNTYVNQFLKKRETLKKIQLGCTFEKINFPRFLVIRASKYSSIPIEKKIGEFTFSEVHPSPGVVPSLSFNKLVPYHGTSRNEFRSELFNYSLYFYCFLGKPE